MCSIHDKRLLITGSFYYNTQNLHSFCKTLNEIVNLFVFHTAMKDRPETKRFLPADRQILF